MAAAIQPATRSLAGHRILIKSLVIQCSRIFDFELSDGRVQNFYPS
jgi:hypothetical protein